MRWDNVVRWERLGAFALAVVVLYAVSAAPARAGEFMQALCKNPNGSAAPTDGMSFSDTNDPIAGPYYCGTWPWLGFVAPPGALAASIQPKPAPGPSSATWTYTAPAGASIAGGSIDVVFYQNFPYDTAVDEWISTPNDASDAGDLVADCLYPHQDLTSTCAPAPPPGPTTGVVPINHPGGTRLFVTAECSTAVTDACYNTDYTLWVWLTAGFTWAEVLLSDDTTPTGSNFAGSLLAPGAVHGTAQLTFTATDPSGPGVDQVIVRIDGRTVYQGTPNTNGGKCVPVGTDPSSGAWIFDYQQPCPESVDVDVPVNTSALADGEHEVQVVVEDAAQNSSTVLDQMITTDNLTTVAATTSEQPGSSLGSAPTYAFELTAPSQRLASSVVRRSYAASALTLSGTVLNSSGAPAANVAVSVQSGALTATQFATVAQTITDGTGRFSVTVPRGDSRTIRLLAGASVVAFKELVAPNLSLQVKSLPGARLLFTGRVQINANGAPAPLVELWDRTPNGWQLLASATANKLGRFRYMYRSSPLTIGYKFAFRATTPQTAAWQAATSAVREATVTG